MTSYFNRGPARDPKYLAWVRTLPCLVSDCRRGPIEVNHIGRRGMSQRSSDYETVPLCRFHHRQFHDKGRKWFEEHHGVELRAMAVKLREGVAA